jgi:hypothetical protein
MVRLALEEERLPVRARALVNLGMAGKPLDTDQETSVCAILTTTRDPEVSRAAVAALGMTGAGALESLRHRGDPGHRWAATWWSQAGSAVHDDDGPTPPWSLAC